MKSLTRKLVGIATLSAIVVVTAVLSRHANAPRQALVPPAWDIETITSTPCAKPGWRLFQSVSWGYRFCYPPSATFVYEDQFVSSPEEDSSPVVEIADQADGGKVLLRIDTGTSVDGARRSGMAGSDEQVLKIYAEHEFDRNLGLYATSDLRAGLLGQVPMYTYVVEGGHVDLLEFGDGTNLAASGPNIRIITLCRRSSDGLLYILRLMFSDEESIRAMVDSFACPLVMQPSGL